MRLIDADAFAAFIKDAIKKQKYEDLKVDGLLTVADVLEAVVSELDGTSLDGLKNAPTVNQWIPCSEETGDGYPDEDGFYYVTEQNYGFYLDADYKQRVAHTSHFKNGDFINRFYDENHSNITAWMPLPAACVPWSEPYNAVN